MKKFRVPEIQHWAVAGMLLILLQKVNAGDTTPTPSQKVHEKRKANILSFDGGGSRGIMEVAILDDVMRLVTIVKKNPISLEHLSENIELLLDQNKRKALVDDLSNVTDPIHPNEVFDMIVGTSTGGLIAFGLVGGKEDVNGKRVPMSLRECIEMYLNNTGKIFEQSWYPSPFRWKYGIPYYPYSTENLERVLFNQFGESNMKDFRDSKTVAGAVAKKIGEKEELVLFDTQNDIHKLYLARKVLLATADAPIYFETPVKIGLHQYIDGGVGGNCPLAQAIPRAKDIFGDVEFVLSVAPPSSPETHSTPSLVHWLKYFAEQVTDGYAVYKDVKRRHKSFSFRRLTPRGDKLKSFKLDENNAQEMLDAIKEEKLMNELFLVDVMATAAFVFDAYITKSGDSTEASAKAAAQLARLAGKIYKAKHKQDMAEDSFRTSLRLWSKVTDENVKKFIAETEGEFSENLMRQAKYFEASKFANLSLQNWKVFHYNKDHENVSNALLTYGTSLHLGGDYKEGYKNYKLALEMQKRIYGEHAINARVANILAQMGWVCHQYGHMNRAESLVINALIIQRQLYGGDKHIDVAKTLDILGLCFTSERKFKKGLKYLQDSLNIKEFLLDSKSHPDIAHSYNNLGRSLVRQQKYEDAHTHLQLALSVNEAWYGDNHESTALILDNIAASLAYKGEYDDALERAQQALNIKKRLFDDVENPMIAESLHTIGLCLVKKKNFSEANEYLMRAVKIIRDVFESKDHPTLAIFLNTLGDSFVGMGNYSDAKVHFDEALKIIDGESAGDLHPDIQDIPDLLRKLADMSEKQGDGEDEIYYKKRLERMNQQTEKVSSNSKKKTQVDGEICSSGGSL